MRMSPSPSYAASSGGASARPARQQGRPSSHVPTPRLRADRANRCLCRKWGLLDMDHLNLHSYRPPLEDSSGVQPAWTRPMTPPAPPCGTWRNRNAQHFGGAAPHRQGPDAGWQDGRPRGRSSVNGWAGRDQRSSDDAVDAAAERSVQRTPTITSGDDRFAVYRPMT